MWANCKKYPSEFLHYSTRIGLKDNVYRNMLDDNVKKKNWLGYFGDVRNGIRAIGCNTCTLKSHLA